MPGFGEDEDPTSPASQTSGGGAAAPMSEDEVSHARESGFMIAD